jgi:hypothetical protein
VSFRSCRSTSVIQLLPVQAESSVTSELLSTRHIISPAAENDLALEIAIDVKSVSNSTTTRKTGKNEARKMFCPQIARDAIGAISEGISVKKAAE